MTKPVLKPRTVELRYKPEVIGQKAIDQVCRYYQNGLQLHDIILRVNAARPSNVTVNLADVYTIINIAAQQKKLKQRKKFLELELRINDFVLVYRAWKSGMPPKEILSLLPHSRIGVERAIRALRARLKEERVRLELKADACAREILGLATSAVFENRLAYVIFYDDIPKHLIDTSGLRRPDLEEDLLIEHRKTVDDMKAKNPRVSTGNKKPQPEEDPDPQDRGEFLDRTTEDSEPLVIQTEEEILSDEIYKITEGASDEAKEEETAKSVKDKLDEIL
jgi:hypothetical protein